MIINKISNTAFLGGFRIEVENANIVQNNPILKSNLAMAPGLLSRAATLPPNDKLELMLDNEGNLQLGHLTYGNPFGDKVEIDSQNIDPQGNKLKGAIDTLLARASGSK